MNKLIAIQNITLRGSRSETSEISVSVEEVEHFLADEDVVISFSMCKVLNTLVSDMQTDNLYTLLQRLAYSGYLSHNSNYVIHFHKLVACVLSSSEHGELLANRLIELVYTKSWPTLFHVHRSSPACIYSFLDVCKHFKHNQSSALEMACSFCTTDYPPFILLKTCSLFASSLTQTALLECDEVRGSDGMQDHVLWRVFELLGRYVCTNYISNTTF
jgi:hypothetical protein